MYLSEDKIVLCLSLLLEGNSIRSIERITGVTKQTLLNLLVLAGDHCRQVMNSRIKGVAVKDIEADEIWGFVGMKKMTKLNKAVTREGVGDAYTFVGIERNTKLILAWHLGERDAANTEAFTEKLHRATSGHFQITTDGLASYPDAIRYSLGTRVDYAMLIKVYGKTDREGEQKYSPPEVVDTETKSIIGSPDPRRICTSIVERSNLSMRTSIRRLTRLTNAFSKKWENLHAMLSLYFAYYNFCRDSLYPGNGKRYNEPRLDVERPACGRLLMITEYFICRADSPAQLQDAINEGIKNGWQPIGGVAASVKWLSGEYRTVIEHEVLYQALVRISDDQLSQSS
jgi:IS1 family transposase